MTANGDFGTTGEGAGGEEPRTDAEGRRPGGLGRDIFGQKTDLCTDHMVAGPFTVPSYQPEGLVELVRAAQRADQRHPKWRPIVPHSQASLVVSEAEPGLSLARLLASETDPVDVWNGAAFPPEADDGTLVEMVAGCERMVHHYAALQARFVQELVERRTQTLRTVQSVGDEIGARLSISNYAGEQMVTRSMALADLPRVSDALAQGLISSRKVDIITAALAGLEQEQAENVEDYALEIAPTHTPSQLKKKLAEAVLVQDPEAAEERNQSQRTQRHVSCQPVEHGMAWISAYLPVEDAAAVFTCIDSMAAHRAEDDERGIDARRADAFSQIFAEALAAGRTPGGDPLPLHQGVPAHLRLSVTAPVLAGDAETPALLHGFGPITAPAARRLIGERGCREAAMRYRAEGGLVSAPREDDTDPGAWPSGADPWRSDALGGQASVRGALAGQALAGEALAGEALAGQVPGTEAPGSEVPARASRRASRRSRTRGEVCPLPPAHTDHDQTGRPPVFPTGYPGVLATSTPPAELPFGRRTGPDGDRLFRHTPPAWPANLPDGTDPRALRAWVKKRLAANPGPPGDGRDRCALIERELGLIAADSYAPSRRLRRRIVERDQVCRFPGCQVPGRRCQLDHIVPFDPQLPGWAQTVETNLHLLCAHHHQLKTEGVFRVDRDVRTGQTTWHAPTGHVYVRNPEPADLVALEMHLRADLDVNRCTKRYARFKAERARAEARSTRCADPWHGAVLDHVAWIHPTCPARSGAATTATSERAATTAATATAATAATAPAAPAAPDLPAWWPEADSEPPF